MKQLPGVIANLPARLTKRSTWGLLLLLGVGYVLLRASGFVGATATVPAVKPPKEGKVTKATEPKHVLADEINDVKAANAELTAQVKALLTAQKEAKGEEQKLLAKFQQDLQSRDQKLLSRQAELEAALKAAQARKASTPPTPAPPAGTPVSTRAPSVTPKPLPTPTPALGTFKLRTLRPTQESKRQLAPLANAQDTAYLPETCFAPATVVTGADVGAPGTGMKWGYPLLYVISGAFTCPWHLGQPGEAPRPSGIPIQGCFVMAHAEANLAASRAVVGLDSMACVLPNGETFEEPIKGYVVDSDGKLGMFGKVERHESAAVAKALVLGAVQEAASALSVARSQLVVTPGYGTQPFQGMQTTLNQLGQFYVEQARSLLPTLAVDSGKKATIVLQKGVPLPSYPTLAYLRGEQ